MSDDRSSDHEKTESSERTGNEQSDRSTKTQDLTKAGRDDFDPDAGTE